VLSKYYFAKKWEREILFAQYIKQAKGNETYPLGLTCGFHTSAQFSFCALLL